MPVTSRTLPWAGAFVLISTLAFAQPKPQSQPPLPQDPTPIPAPTPKVIEKPEPQPPQPAPAGRLGGSELVLSGCLQLADTPKPPAGATASPSDTPAIAGYILRHAQPVATDGTRPSGDTRGKDYRIVASHERVKLADLTGHQVKVTGRVKVQGEPQGRTATETGRSASEPSGATGVSTTPQASLPPASLVTLSVSRIESMAPSCKPPAS